MKSPWGSSFLREKTEPLPAVVSAHFDLAWDLGMHYQANPTESLGLTQEIACRKKEETKFVHSKEPDMFIVSILHRPIQRVLTWIYSSKL